MSSAVNTTVNTTGSTAVLDADERAQLRESAAGLLGRAASSERVRAVVAAGGDPDRELIARIAELGWFGLEVPDELGGAGAGFAELVLLLEEIGARTASAPLLSSAVLCAGALLLGGSAAQQARWLPGLAEGTVLGTAALPACPGRAGEVAIEVLAEPAEQGWTLTGTVALVPDARISDLVVVVARSSAGPLVGVVQRSAPGVTVTATAMTDATRALDEVRFDGAVLAAADVLAAAEPDDLVAALLNRAAVALAADSVGAARRVLEMTVAHAGQRQQFGRAIGSFQAVKHQAADMLVALETSRDLTLAAAAAVGTDPARAGVAASMAKSHACGAGSDVVGTGLQLHGGIGYTWEHDLHLHLKRVALNEHLVGGGTWHRARIAVGMFDEAAELNAL